MIFEQRIEEMNNLTYVTSDSLKIPRGKFNPKSAQIKVSLKVLDQRWRPRHGLQKWNAQTRTFEQVGCIVENQRYVRHLAIRSNNPKWNCGHCAIDSNSKLEYTSTYPNNIEYLHPGFGGYLL